MDIDCDLDQIDIDHEAYGTEQTSGQAPGELEAVETNFRVRLRFRSREMMQI